MPLYRYRILQKDGRLAEGSVEARGRGEAARRLNERGMQVLSLEEERRSAQAASGGGRPGAAAGPPRRPEAGELRLGSNQLIHFTEELGDLLSAGIPLDAALHSMAKRSESPAVRKAAELCHERVRDGVPLAASLHAASASFDELYCNLVSAGEQSGALAEILRRQSGYLTTLAELRSKLATALIYPFFLMFAGAGVLGMFVFFLMPRLRRLVESAGGSLPPVARGLLGAGDFLAAHWPVLLAAAVAAVALSALLVRNPAVRFAWDRWKLSLPLWGPLLRMRFNVQFVETLSNLLGNGLPLVRALELASGATGNRFIRGRLREITERVSEGALLHRTMERAGLFDPGVVDMVRVGEDTGKLARSLARAGERLDRRLARGIERIATVMQPAIVLVMAVVVGGLAYLMISIIYDTISILRDR